MPKRTEKKPAAAKYEWRKTEKAFYLPKEKGPARIDVPEMKFFVVDGAGSPASPNQPELTWALSSPSSTTQKIT